jgi:hypothetical protein
LPNNPRRDELVLLHCIYKFFRTPKIQKRTTGYFVDAAVTTAVAYLIKRRDAVDAAVTTTAVCDLAHPKGLLWGVEKRWLLFQVLLQQLQLLWFT